MTMDITLGYLLHENKTRNAITLPWDNIGILIVGRPGSGKSHVIASLLTQYALKKVSLIVAEYNADATNPQSLLYRIQHLTSYLHRPPATTAQEIIDIISFVKEELKARQTGKSPRTPLVVVIDEFFQFAASSRPPEEINVKRSGDARTDEGETIIRQKAPTFWEDLLASQTDLRKNNIRLILAAQEIASTATSNLMRQVRDMFRFKLLMNLSPKGSDLLGISDKESQRIIDKLGPGRIFWNGHIIAVPFPLHPEWLRQVEEHPHVHVPKQPIQKESAIVRDWTEKEVQAYIHTLLQRHGPLAIIRYDRGELWNIETFEDIIELLVLHGWSQNKIETVLSSARSSIRQTVKNIKSANLLPHSNAENK